MAQFLVPQFIDVEDKIIGPITVRQFVIMVVAGVLAVVEYKLLSFWVFVVVAFITVAAGATLAFVKINGRPMHYFLLNFVQTIKRPFRRVWNKAAYVSSVIEVKSEIAKEIKIETKKKRTIVGSHLSELSLIINTGGVYKPEEDIFIDVKGNKKSLS